MKRTLSIVLIAVAVGISCLAGAGRAQASVSLTTVERQVLTCVNRERAKHGLAAVHAQTNLMRAARAHSRSMAASSYFSHSSLGGSSFASRLIAFGYGRAGYRRWMTGENIYCARVGTLYATPQVAVMRWMASSSHRAVVLTAAFRDAGIGVARGGNTRYFTLDMGRRIR
jgi:uncharacterized protein YkwD